MTGTIAPLVFVITALVLHAFFAIGIRGRMYAHLDALPDDVRRDLGWIARHEARSAPAYADLVKAKVRLAHQPLSKSPRIPDHVYQAERSYKLHVRADTALVVFVILAFALVEKDAWMISLVLAAGFAALHLYRRRLAKPWPRIA